MKLFESLRISWRSIKGHKLRSVLTTLGVIIGIGAVIAMIILGAGVKADFVEDIGSEQKPDLLVYTETNTGGGFQLGQAPKFTEHDIQNIEEIENVKAVYKGGRIPIIQLKFRNTTSTSVSFESVTTNRFESVEFKSGGPFKMGEKQAVINKQMSRSTEPNMTVGDRFTVYFRNGSSTEIEVTGVLNESLGFNVQQVGPRVYMPTEPFYNTKVTSPSKGELQKAYPNLRVRTTGLSELEGVQAQIKEYLKTESDARELKEEDYKFSVKTSDDIVSQITGFLDTITAFITGIALIALIVGSIGIANIMLVSVTERTREIGIMKAIGARRRDIIQLFLIESVILGIIGAFVGVLLGVGGGYLFTQLIDTKMVLPFEWFGISIAVGVLVGILAGVYPAWRGARVDPIEALRYE